MSTSGSTDYSVNRDDIIKRALRLVGVTAQGEDPTTDQITEAAVALNGLVKAWQADGMPLWALKQYSVPLSAGQAVYSIGVGQAINTAKPLKLIQCFNRNTTSSIDTPVRILTKQEYSILGNKTSSGNPIQVYYEPLLDSGNLYVFPVPSTSDADSNVLVITYQRPFEDFDSASDTPDFPNEWYDAITYGLASRLAGEYQISTDSRKLLKMEAAELKQEALSFGGEVGSLYFGVERRDW